VLVLDDLQWADEASAVLLVEVARQLRGTRILALATYRDSPDGILSGLSAEANAERVDLHGLPADAVGDLLLAAGLDSSPAQARQVHDETAGNPFLIRELARTLTEPGLTGPAVPGRVLEATAYRITQGNTWSWPPRSPWPPGATPRRRGWLARGSSCSATWDTRPRSAPWR
jgi:hypothetical protein